MNYRYGLQFRPADIGAVPKGLSTIEPPLTDIEGNGKRLTRHGIIVYSRPLTEQEVCAFELVVIADHDLIEELAIEVAKCMSEYAKEYLQIANEDYKVYCASIVDALYESRKYNVYVGSYDHFGQMVKVRLENIVASLE